MFHSNLPIVKLQQILLLEYFTTRTSVWYHETLMPGFHHSVVRCRSSVAVSPFCRCKIPLFCKKLRKKIPFLYSRKQQNDTQRQRQRCTETATANWNGETATEERQQRNGGNQALSLNKLNARFIVF